MRPASPATGPRRRRSRPQATSSTLGRPPSSAHFSLEGGSRISRGPPRKAWSRPWGAARICRQTRVIRTGRFFPSGWRGFFGPSRIYPQRATPYYCSSSLYYRGYGGAPELQYPRQSRVRAVWAGKLYRGYTVVTPKLCTRESGAGNRVTLRGASRSLGLSPCARFRPTCRTSGCVWSRRYLGVSACRRRGVFVLLLAEDSLAVVADANDRGFAGVDLGAAYLAVAEDHECLTS